MWRYYIVYRVHVILTFCCARPTFIIMKKPQIKHERMGTPVHKPSEPIIYNRIAELRAERGLSRQELAQALEISYQDLGYLEPVSYTHLRAHETRHDLVCRLL